MRHHNLTQLAEAAIAGYLTDNKPEWCQAVYRGLENVDTWEMEGQESSLKAYPSIFVFCESQTPVSPWRGNWTPRVEVRVVSIARDTTTEEHMDRAGEVFDLLLTTTAATDFAAHVTSLWIGQVMPGDAGHRIEDGKWISTLQLELQSAYVNAPNSVGDPDPV